MVFEACLSARLGGVGGSVFRRAGLVAALVTAFATIRANPRAEGQEPVSTSEKHIIGATETITEANSGIEFAARIDTGAKTCSLHVEQMEIEDESTRRLENIGKTVRFLIKGEGGKAAWLERQIVAAVRVKSSMLKTGEFDQRYKVRLALEWKNVRKEVLVTLNDRTEMAYPMLIGRNFLRGDFLVDVAKQNDES
jgi:hypothetical protein